MKVLKNLWKFIVTFVIVFVLMGVGSLFAILTWELVRLLGDFGSFIALAGIISLIIWIVWMLNDRY